MKKRFILYVGLIFGLIVAIALPIFFKTETESVNQIISLTTSIISTIASLFTFIIALSLFNRYGIEAPLIEKHTSNVFLLLEQLKKTQFSIVGQKFSFWIKMSDPFKYASNIKDYYSEKLIFSEDYYYGLESLFEISNNPFIPKSIADTIDKFQFFVMLYDINEINCKEYAQVSVVKFKKSENPKFGRFNASDLTLLEFLTMIDEVKSAITKWLQSNSVSTVNLNW
jgi:hypothetical protein